MRRLAETHRSVLRASAPSMPCLGRNLRGRASEYSIARTSPVLPMKPNKRSLRLIHRPPPPAQSPPTQSAAMRRCEHLHVVLISGSQGPSSRSPAAPSGECRSPPRLLPGSHPRLLARAKGDAEHAHGHSVAEALQRYRTGSCCGDSLQLPACQLVSAGHRQ